MLIVQKKFKSIEEILLSLVESHKIYEKNSELDSKAKIWILQYFDVRKLIINHD